MTVKMEVDLEVGHGLKVGDAVMMDSGGEAGFIGATVAAKWQNIGMALDVPGIVAKPKVRFDEEGKTWRRLTDGEACCVPVPESSPQVSETPTPVPEATEPANDVQKPGAQSRPTLEVAMETHTNLQGRIEALCTRMLAWKDAPQSFLGAAEDCIKAWQALGGKLDELRMEGFVATSTPRTRIKARIQVGGRFKLCDSVRATYAMYYAPDELDRVSIVGHFDDQVFVKLGSNPAALPFAVKLGQLVPVD